MTTSINIARPEVRLTKTNVTAFLTFKLGEEPGEQVSWTDLYDELYDALTERAERQKAIRKGVPYRDLRFASDYRLSMGEEEKVDGQAYSWAGKF